MATIPSVSPTELIRTSWGNAVATELNANTVKADGSQAMTGSLILTASPGLKLRNGSNNPFLYFESSSGAAYGYIQGTATQMVYNLDAAGFHLFYTGGAERFRIADAGVTVAGTLTVAGVLTASAATTSIGGTSITITSGTGSTVHNTGGSHQFKVNGTEVGRIAGSNFLWGKTAADGGGTDGVELATAGRIGSTISTSGATNVYLRHVGTAQADGVAYVQFANTSGTILSEINQDNVAPSGINITNCTTTAPSDYRMKNDLGPIVGALDRVLNLQPKHLAWKDTGREFDGFIAHELADVVPDAVIGEKDAVYDADEAERMGVEPGDIKAQQLDQLPLIPLLTAALQELTDRVAALEAP